MGEPLRDLPVVRSMGGVLEYTSTDIPLDSDSGNAGAPTSALPSVPAEIFRVRGGDRIRLRTPAQHRSTGETSWTTVDIPTDYPAGLHWHHPQVASSPARLPGLVIVEGDIDDLDGITHARERTMVLAPAGSLPGQVTPPPPPPPATGEPPMTPRPTLPATLTTAVNGQILPDIDIQPGEIQRWRIVNTEPERAIWLHVEGHSMYQIGQDGVPFTQPRATHAVMLHPGNRAEVLVRATKPGRYRVYAERYHQGDPGGVRPTALLATMAVAGRPIFNRLPRTLGADPVEPTGSVAVRRTAHVGADPRGAGPRAVVDGNVTDLDRLARRGTTGTVEEWTLVNDDTVQHPVHAGGYWFHVMDVQGVPAGDPSWQASPHVWWDTYRLPPKGQVTLRVYLRAGIS
ncbi:multicopper oxidase family protein [Phytoactinopolyspora limicola]|uniref:multicopper oxidase family protein n=1 Tax=Phytoactinopolyspora limicola TaxID=2715536 RepID=UPI001409F7FC|nr:multicopper oxidase domain-containing protein [Phytoactinopolyspora limicola]